MMNIGYSTISFPTSSIFWIISSSNVADVVWCCLLLSSNASSFSSFLSCFALLVSLSIEEGAIDSRTDAAAAAALWLFAFLEAENDSDSISSSSSPNERSFLSLTAYIGKNTHTHQHWCEIRLYQQDRSLTNLSLRKFLRFIGTRF